MSTYDRFARCVIEEGLITDPWLDGRPRLREEPYRVTERLQRELYRAAEDVAGVYHELCLIAGDHPEVVEDFFGMTAFQRAMWLASQPAWHGIARADVFVTDDGLAFSEINCDTPTGEPEAVVLGRLVAPDHAGAVDPNAGLVERYARMVQTFAREELDEASDCPPVGIVYPTEFTEDLALVRLLKRTFEERGHEVVLGSPFNLDHDPARGLLLFDRPVQIVLRHYKTDWWGERISAWDDDEVPDKQPLAEPLAALISAMAEGQATVVNPLGAVLPQNKRAMAFMWEHIHRFSPRSQAIIERHVPLTSRLETMHPEQLLAQQDEWVIKSDYGAEGDEVIIGRAVGKDVWRATVDHARPGRWIAQRYFEARGVDGREPVNHGVFLIGGEACGLYARIQVGATDENALSAPVLVVP